jgi:glycosyltransferase involved in cell wall biosynthesis
MPVVATRHADIPFIVAAGDCVVAEEDVEGLADTLVRLARSSDADWRARSEAGRRAVESKHDAAVIARAIEGLYAEARALVPPR